MTVNEQNPSRSKRLTRTLELGRWMVKNLNFLRVLREIQSTRTWLVRVNMLLGSMSSLDRSYPYWLNEFNRALIEATKGKWLASKAMETRSKATWRKAFRSLTDARAHSEGTATKLSQKETAPFKSRPLNLRTKETEIQFADEVPLVPGIQPIVLLSGSEYEMGYQYAQQLSQIFGHWILERKAGRGFTADEKRILRRWEAELREHAPEILNLCQGWVAGANEAGVAMTYDDVLDIWTGHRPPASNYFGLGDGNPLIGAPLCSGVAAWGRASSDGRLVAGSSGDHDPTFSVTVVAYPEDGNNLVFTPFSAVGDVPVVGPVYMMGHPGMNNQGVGYIEHGGSPTMIEPKDKWGYGLRLGASIWQVLRHANSAREAMEMELALPIGDAGRPVSSPGAFYADGGYGYVLESRASPVLLREAGTLGEQDFLFANNSAMHPGAEQAGWMQRNRENWQWDERGGWHPAQVHILELLSLRRRGSSGDTVGDRMGHIYHNSYHRNLYLYRMMELAAGHVDLEYMKMIYRNSGTLPEGSWEDISKAYRSRGTWGEYSVGHAGNALVAVMKPDRGDRGVYGVCSGTAARGLTPNAPNPAGGPVFDETNAFWEIRLAAEPYGVVQQTKAKAEDDLIVARTELESNELKNDPPARLQSLLEQAESQLDSGRQSEAKAESASGHDRIYFWARAIRGYTTAQVRARQVSHALAPPPNKPENSGS